MVWLDYNGLLITGGFETLVVCQVKGVVVDAYWFGCIVCLVSYFLEEIKSEVLGSLGKEIACENLLNFEP